MHRGDRERTIIRALRRAVAEGADRPFIVTGDVTYSFGDVDRMANRLAHGFSAQGVAGGEPVVVMLSDHVQSIVLWLALAKIGAVDVTINTGYQGDILTHVVNDSGGKLLIASPEFLERLAAIEKDLVALRRILVHGSVPRTGSLPAACELSPLECVISENAEPPDHDPRESDLLSVIYTSGTTGRSKGVMVCHAHAYTYATGCAETMELTKEDILYTAGLPQFHITARLCLVGNALIYGVPVAVPAKFSVSGFWDDIRRYRATKAVLVGAMAALLKGRPPAPGDRDHTLKKVLMAPLLKDLHAFRQRFGVEACSCYGGTEFNVPALCTDATSTSDSALVGRMRADLFDLRVVDENDEEVGPGVVGELVVRAKQPWLLMLGYWRRPEATVNAWRNLWYHTGDAGRYDTEGNFYFVDRLKDTIRRRGENISSMELEGVIVKHPDILECAVFPVDSELTEQEVMTSVVLKPGSRIGAQDLWRFLDMRLPAFMVPRYIDFVEALPKTMNGKITKMELRKRGVTRQAFDRQADKRH